MRDAYHDPGRGASVWLVDLGGDAWLVSGVEVNKQFRRQGAARALMGRVLADADREGVTLLLSVDPQEPWEVDGDALRVFYESLGFRGRADMSMERVPCLVPQSSGAASRERYPQWKVELFRAGISERRQSASGQMSGRATRAPGT